MIPGQEPSIIFRDMLPRSPLAGVPGVPARYSVVSLVLLLGITGCAPTVQTTRPLPVKAADGVASVQRMAQSIGFEFALGPVADSLRANGKLLDSSIRFPAVDARIETPKSSNPLASGMIAVLKVQERTDSGSDLSIGVVSKQGYDVGAYANLFHGAVLQQLEFDAGRRQPHGNPLKSTVGFCLRNTFAPAWGTHYAGSGNPLLGPASRTIAYSNYWMLDAYGAAMLAHGFLASDAAQRRESLGTGILCLVINRAFGYFGVTDISAYNRIATSPYNLAEIAF